MASAVSDAGSLPSDRTQGDAPTRNAGPIWLIALERYYGELRKGGVKESMIEKELWDIESPEELLAQIEVVAPSEIQAATVWPSILMRLEPILLGLNDFAAVVAWTMGMDQRVAAILWGSIRLMIKVCGSPNSR
jgi:hypothetical protein